MIKQSSVTPSSAHLESTTMQEIDGPPDQILAVTIHCMAFPVNWCQKIALPNFNKDFA